MNDQQLLCFLTVSRTLNFSAAARELFITQPALSYQIRSLEKELDVQLFARTTTKVELTAAGCAFEEPARQLYRQLLCARDAVRPFLTKRRLVVHLPAMMVRRDSRYHIMMEQVNRRMPEYEIELHNEMICRRFHNFLSGGVDAIIALPLGPAEPEVTVQPVFPTRCFLVASPAHTLAGREELLPADLQGMQLYYEKSESIYVGCVREQLERAGVNSLWLEVESYDLVYAALAAGRGLFICPVRFDAFPQEWYMPLRTPQPLPDTCLMTLSADSRPALAELVSIIREVYRED